MSTCRHRVIQQLAFHRADLTDSTAALAPDSLRRLSNREPLAAVEGPLEEPTSKACLPPRPRRVLRCKRAFALLGVLRSRGVG